MNPSPEEALFQLALAKPAEKRAAFLDVTCEGDAALRQRLEALLAAHEQPETLLATQADTARPTIKLDLADAPDEAVGQRLGRYKLLERVGEGGCGVVYVAEQTEPVRRRVALKVIKLGMDTKQVVARFEAERQALAMMDHPNIAKVLDAGTTDVGRPYFVMELVRGIRITDYCDQANLSTKERLDLFIKVCQAIQHAHQKGIIHRDIKPSNILVTLHDGVPVPKVIDFGIAKATEGRLTDNTVYTQLHQFIGTPAYMSPEQAEMTSLDIDTRSDIYSLGVLLYELLAGSTPFDAQELMSQGIDAMRKIIREQEPVRPSTRFATLKGVDLTTAAKRRAVEAPKLIHQLKGDLDWIVMKCLEKDRTRRYDTANGLAMDIHRHLTNETVVARPPSGAYRLQKLVRRNKGLVAAASVVLAALVAGFVGTAWGLFEAKKQTRAAERRLAQIQKANDIIGSIFENLDPKQIVRNERPLQAILAESLDKAVAQLEGESIGDPLVVAAMQDKFGKTLNALGEPANAIILLEKSVATRKAGLGPKHPDTLTSMNNLFEAYGGAGKLDLALSLAEKVFKLRKDALGPDHPDTIESMNNLGNVYNYLGKADSGQPMLEEALKLSKVRLGPDHRITLYIKRNLADAYLSTGKFDLAVALADETFKLRKARLGPKDPDTLDSMSFLAMAYGRAGKMDLALPLFEEAFKLCKTTLGATHPTTLTAMDYLADAYQTAGKYDLSLPMFEEALKVKQAKFGSDHQDTLGSMNNLATAYGHAGKSDLVLPLLEETVKLVKTKFGPDHENTLSVMATLAGMHAEVRNYDRAISLLEEVLPLAKSKLGPDHPKKFEIMSFLGNIYLAAGKRALALPLLEEALPLTKAKFGSDHPATLSAMVCLAAAYREIGKDDLAIPLFEETLKLTKAKLGADSPQTLSTMNQLGDTYLAAGKFDLAIALNEEWFNRAKAAFGPGHAQTLVSAHILVRDYIVAGRIPEAVMLGRESVAEARKAFPPDSPVLGSALSSYGWASLEAKAYAEAEVLLRECLAIRERKSSPDDWRLFGTKSMLGGALLGQKKYAEAGPLLLASYEGLKQRESVIVRVQRPRLAEALDRLIAWATAMNQPADVKKWQTERAKYPPAAEVGK